MPQITAAKLLGQEPEGRVTIDKRQWESMRRIVVRMVIGWGHARREAERILEACRHAPGCEAIGDRSVPCLPDCPDREVWLSALVCARNAEEWTTRVDLPRRDTSGQYMPPTREYWDRIVAELEALRVGREAPELGQVPTDVPRSPAAELPTPATLDEIAADPRLPTTRLIEVSESDEPEDERDEQD